MTVMKLIRMLMQNQSLSMKNIPSDGESTRLLHIGSLVLNLDHNFKL